MGSTAYRGKVKAVQATPNSEEANFPVGAGGFLWQLGLIKSNVFPSISSRAARNHARSKHLRQICENITFILGFEQRQGPIYAVLHDVFNFYLFFLWLAADLDRIFSQRVMVLPLLLFPILFLLIVFTRNIFITLRNRQWRRLTSVLVAPVAILLLRMELMRAQITPAYLQFELWKSYYQKETLKLTSIDGLPRIKVWDWGEVGGVAVPNIIYILIYDDSDQIAISY